MIRTWLLSWVVCAGLLLPCVGMAQAPPPQPPVMPEAKNADAPKPEGQGQAEPPSALVHYTLAAIGTLIVMLLICMPARRE